MSPRMNKENQHWLKGTLPRHQKLTCKVCGSFYCSWQCGRMCSNCAQLMGTGTIKPKWTRMSNLKQKLWGRPNLIGSNFSQQQQLPIFEYKLEQGLPKTENAKLLLQTVNRQEVSLWSNEWGRWLNNPPTIQSLMFTQDLERTTTIRFIWPESLEQTQTQKLRWTR